MSRPHYGLKKIAITGGIGSGKSALTSCLAQIGYPIFDADCLVAKVVQLPEVQNQLCALLGSSAFEIDSEGNKVYNRVWVRDQVFADSAKRTALERILHPAIFAEFEDICRSIEKNAGGVWVFYEAALIFESGREAQFDAVVAVCADEKMRRERLERHRSLSSHSVSAIIAAQVTDQVRRSKANFIIENSGSKSDLTERAAELVESLRQFFHPKSH
jgi:dephospho-CoA kinase